MTDTIALFYHVTSFHGRIFPSGVYRRIIRFRIDGVVNSLGTVAAACTTITMAAVWLINIGLATDSNLYAIAVTNHDPTLASAAGLIGSARVSTDPADDLTFEAKWARAIVPASVSAAGLIGSARVSTGPTDDLTFEVLWARATAPNSKRTGVAPFVPLHSVERSSNVASLQANPLAPPQSRAKPKIAHAPDSMHVAELTPAVTPASAHLSALTRPTKLASERTNSVPLARLHPAQYDFSRSPINRAISQIAAAISEMRVTLPPPDPDSRTAVYDIAAQTVYLPNGDKLEAHSGLGNMLDDPRYVSVKNRGPTPPNVYNLALRENIFHGALAIRLIPVGDGNMFGRDGILAHPYLLSDDGQSNGCVSLKDYPAFLQAYLRGEIDRLVVVPHLGNTSWRTAIVRRGSARRYADNNS